MQKMAGFVQPDASFAMTFPCVLISRFNVSNALFQSGHEIVQIRLS